MLIFKIHNYVIYVFYRVSGYHAFGTRIRDYVRFVLKWCYDQKIISLLSSDCESVFA